jgi:bifunctional ADP-heptose synthase (sugar kinase/adenylyltransferase)|tara:strand:+ start:333 stop:1094 length:762 start_codon:yes stop_codon:yes gene_type:complete
MKILIVGDSCIDVFVYGDVTRLSPEAPVPVFNPLRKTENDGMARNVANNVEALESVIYTITNKNSIRKVRYVEDKSNQLILRVDEHDYCDRIDDDTLSSIQDNKCHITMTGTVDVDAIIISDYCKGFLEEEDIEFICENNDNVFVDTKKKLGKWLNSATYVKINDLEYKNSFETIDNISKEKLIITQGKNGCIYNDEVFPVEEVTVKDVSGAGDTFLASLAVNYVKSNDIKKSIKFAQKCATLVVQKHGVVTV